MPFLCPSASWILIVSFNQICSWNSCRFAFFLKKACCIPKEISIEWKDFDYSSKLKKILVTVRQTLHPLSCNVPVKRKLTGSLRELWIPTVTLGRGSSLSTMDSTDSEWSGGCWLRVSLMWQHITQTAFLWLAVEEPFHHGGEVMAAGLWDICSHGNRSPEAKSGERCCSAHTLFFNQPFRRSVLPRVIVGLPTSGNLV